MVQLGEAAEMAVATQLMKRGFTVSKPLSESEPYDLVVEVESELQKVQVKRLYEQEEKSALKADLYKSKSGSRTSYDSDEVDAFALYHNSTVYWMWFEETPDSTVSLSLKTESEVANNLLPRTRFASDHLLDRKI